MNDVRNETDPQDDAIRALIERTLADAPQPQAFETIVAELRRGPAPVALGRRSRPTLLLAAAAAVLLVAGAVGVSVVHRPPVPDGTASSLTATDVVPLAPTVLPPDLQPDQATSQWWDQPQARVQRFVEENTPGAVLTVVTEATSIAAPAAATASSSPSGGRPTLAGIEPAVLTWTPLGDGGVVSTRWDGTSVSLIVEQADEARARVAVRELVARGADPFEGYDPAPASPWREVEDRSVPAGRRPAATQSWSSAGGRARLVSSIGDDGVVPLAAHAAGLPGPAPVLEAVGGRTALRAGSTVWFHEGSSTVAITASGLSGEELDAVVDSLAPLDEGQWRGRIESAGERLATAELLARIPARIDGLGESTLELRRSGPGAALCIAVGDERRCALGQQGATSGDGPLLAEGADALWFATVAAGGSSGVLGTAGPAFGVEPSLQL
ncbi:MAG: hypothetical protein AB7W59_21640, partial [Acidimicrobiia bacterium]